MSYNKILTDKQNEIITENAIREAGKFLITMFITQHTPFYCAVDESKEGCITIPKVDITDEAARSLIHWAGEAAWQVYKYPKNKTMPKAIYNKLKDTVSQDVANLCRTHLEADIFMLNLAETLLLSLACDLKFYRELSHRDICDFLEIHKFLLPHGVIRFNEFPEFSRKELKNKVRNFKSKNHVA
mgnify:FL=1